MLTNTIPSPFTVAKNSIWALCLSAAFALTMVSPSLSSLLSLPLFPLNQQNTEESLGPSLHYFKKPIIRHQSIYVIRKSLPLQSWLSSLHTVITGTKSIFNHSTDWAHQLSRNIVSCLLCESNIWAKTITLLCSKTIQRRAFSSTRWLPLSPCVAISFFRFLSPSFPFSSSLSALDCCAADHI